MVRRQEKTQLEQLCCPVVRCCRSSGPDRRPQALDLVHNDLPMAEPATKTLGGRKIPKTTDVPWLTRLTHPLVFFGAALAIYEGTIGTALLVSKHSDATVLWLCLLMAVVILVAMATVALLVFKKPDHLMLTLQDTIGVELRNIERIREATRLLVQSPKLGTANELLELMDKVEAILSRGLK